MTFTALLSVSIWVNTLHVIRSVSSIFFHLGDIDNIKTVKHIVYRPFRSIKADSRTCIARNCYRLQLIYVLYWVLELLKQFHQRVLEHQHDLCQCKTQRLSSLWLKGRRRSWIGKNEYADSYQSLSLSLSLSQFSDYHSYASSHLVFSGTHNLSANHSRVWIVTSRVFNHVYV
jgi:hypothetical protein